MHSLRYSTLVQTLALFLIVSAVTLAAAHRFVGHPLLLSPITLTAQWFLVGFFVCTAFLLFLMKTQKRLLFEGIFALTMFSGIWFVGSLFFGELSFWYALVFVATRYAFPYVLVHNILLAISIGGVAVALGPALGWRSVLMILLVLAIYDVIAVYGTKHMVTMFKGLASQGVMFAFIVPDHTRLLLSKIGHAKAGEGFFFLGTGDLALPALTIAAVFELGLPYAVGVAIGGFLGIIFADILFVLLRGRPMPALPPIVVGTLLGFFVVKLLL